jgi:hypothetical protein
MSSRHLPNTVRGKRAQGRPAARARKHLRYGCGASALKAMEAGAVLRCEQIGGKDRWSLSNGVHVSPFVIRALLTRGAIVPTGDGLFFSQTYATVRLARLAGVLSQWASSKETDMGLNMAKYTKRFIKLADVREGPLVRFIADVREGSYSKPELVFDNGEILGLNVTNNLRLMDTYGPDADDWIGKKIELREGEVEYEGKLVKSIMVEPISPGLTAAERLEPVAAKAAAKPVGKVAAKAANDADMNDDIPF